PLTLSLPPSVSPLSSSPPSPPSLHDALPISAVPPELRRRPEASKSHPGSSWPRGDRRRRVVPAPLPRAGRDHDPRSQAPAARDRAGAGALSGGRAAALPPRGGRAADEARHAEGQAADREGDPGPLQGGLRGGAGLGT